MTVDLWMSYICPCSFRWPWPWCKVTVSRQMQKISVECSLQVSKQISVKFATRVGNFLCDLDFCKCLYGMTYVFFSSFLLGGGGGLSVQHPSQFQRYLVAPMPLVPTPLRPTTSNDHSASQACHQGSMRGNTVRSLLGYHLEKIPLGPWIWWSARDDSQGRLCSPPSQLSADLTEPGLEIWLCNRLSFHAFRWRCFNLAR